MANLCKYKKKKCALCVAYSNWAICKRADNDDDDDDGDSLSLAVLRSHRITESPGASESTPRVRNIIPVIWLAME